jgi:PEGA domain
MVDGKFVGNTPSSVKLKTGDHTISIKKKGFTLWERAISLSAGSEISINADLEKQP